MYDVNEAKLTANGRYLYTYGLDGLAVFRRDRRTGRLTQLRYVGTTFEAKAIGVFRRTRRGRLVQLSGRRGYVSRPRRAGCARARISNDPYDVHISPDGRHGYVDGFFLVAAFAVHD